MSKTVWKFPLQIADEQTLRLPAGSSPLYVAEQHGTVCLWVLVDPSMPTALYRILISGTGHPAPDRPYIGSVITLAGELVWHVFDGGSL